MAETDKTPLTMTTMFTYAPETCIIGEDSVLEVGPSDLVFFQGTAQGSKPPMHTFVVLRRTNP